MVILVRIRAERRERPTAACPSSARAQHSRRARERRTETLGAHAQTLLSSGALGCVRRERLVAGAGFALGNQGLQSGTHGSVLVLVLVLVRVRVLVLVQGTARRSWTAPW